MWSRTRFRYWALARVLVNITLARTFGTLCFILFNLTFGRIPMLYVLHTVILVWSKSSKAALVEYVESGLYMVDLCGIPCQLLSAYSLRLTTGVGGLPPTPSKLEGFAKSPL